MTQTSNLPRRIANPVTGDILYFLVSPLLGDGDQLVFRGILPAGGLGAPLHSHDDMVETFEVESGALDIMLAGGVAQRLYAGDRITIEPGTAHGFANALDSETRFITTATPGVELETFLRTLYRLADQGRVNADGSPVNPLAMAVAVDRMDMRLAAVPARLQAIVVGLLAWCARVTGVAKTLSVG